MSEIAVLGILLGGLIFLMALGMEIAFAFGIIGAIGLIVFMNHPAVQIAWTSWKGIDLGALSAAPLFIFMGAILANSGIIRHLFDGTDKWLGGLPGGLATSVTGACALFAAMSGSNVAAVAIFGRAVYPEMEKLGYAPKLALASIAMGGTLAVLIPPSILMIIFGVWVEVSIARLFAAGLIPGVILAVLLMLTTIIRAKLSPNLCPPRAEYTWKDRFLALRNMAPWLGLIAAVLGVIFFGIMTPTEAASLGVFLSVVLSFGYRRMTYRVLKASFLDAVRVTTMVIFILAMAHVLAFVFQRAGIAEAASVYILNLKIGTYGILVSIYVMYLFLGLFFDSISMMVLTLPFIMPIVTRLGFDPIWFGVVYVLISEIGMVTPPFGLNLFVLQGVVPKHSIFTIAYSCLPYMIPLLGLVALLTALPEVALWLPGVLY